VSIWQLIDIVSLNSPIVVIDNMMLWHCVLFYVNCTACCIALMPFCLLLRRLVKVTMQGLCNISLTVLSCLTLWLKYNGLHYSRCQWPVHRPGPVDGLSLLCGKYTVRGGPMGGRLPIRVRLLKLTPLETHASQIWLMHIQKTTLNPICRRTHALDEDPIVKFTAHSVFIEHINVLPRRRVAPFFALHQCIFMSSSSRAVTGPNGVCRVARLRSCLTDQRSAPCIGFHAVIVCQSV